MDFSRPDIPAIASVTPGKATASCLSYHRNGKRLFVASEDARLHIIDTLDTGKAIGPPLKAEKDQLRIVEATHHDNCVLFAGSGENASLPQGQRYAVHYWSTYDNKILRKFRGHTGKVTKINMSPADDTFLTSSDDRTVRLWSAQQAGCLAKCALPDETNGTPTATFDATGLVFGIIAPMANQGGHFVHLYDARNHSAGAFAEMQVSQTSLETAIQSHVNLDGATAQALSQAPWHNMSFNESGSQILATGANGLCVLLDGFEGTIQRVMTSKTDRNAMACFSSDDRTIIAGNDDGSLTCWDVGSGSVVKTLSGHMHPVQSVKANPVYAQLASACKDTALWLFDQ